MGGGDNFRTQFANLEKVFCLALLFHLPSDLKDHVLGGNYYY